MYIFLSTLTIDHNMILSFGIQYLMHISPMSIC